MTLVEEMNFVQLFEQATTYNEAQSLMDTLPKVHDLLEAIIRTKKYFLLPLIIPQVKFEDLKLAADILVEVLKLDSNDAKRLFLNFTETSTRENLILKIAYICGKQGLDYSALQSIYFYPPTEDLYREGLVASDRVDILTDIGLKTEDYVNIGKYCAKRCIESDIYNKEAFNLYILGAIKAQNEITINFLKSKCIEWCNDGFNEVIEYLDFEDIVYGKSQELTLTKETLDKIGYV